MTIEDIAQRSGRSKKLIHKIIKKLGIESSSYSEEDSKLILEQAERKRELLAKRIKDAVDSKGAMSMYQLKEFLGVTYAHIIWAVTEMTYDPKYRGLYETDEGLLNFWSKEEEEEFRDVLLGW